MKYACIDLQQSEDILLLRLQCPERGNRFDLLMLKEMDEALTHAHATDVQAVLITHAGKDFCLGGLLGDPRGQDASSVHRFSDALVSVLLHIFQCPVPVLAAVEGDVQGGGMSLLEACDMVASSTNALFSIPEIKSEMPPVISFASASRVFGEKKTLEMALTGVAVDAIAAYRAGLVTEVTPSGQAELQCMHWIQCFHKRNPAALQTIRRLRQRMDGLQYERMLQSAADLLVSAILDKATWHMASTRDSLKGKTKHEV